MPRREVDRISPFDFMRYLTIAIRQIDPCHFYGCPPQAVSFICVKIEKALRKETPLMIIKDGGTFHPDDRYFVLGNLVFVNEEECNSPAGMQKWLVDSIPVMIKAYLPMMTLLFESNRSISIDGVEITRDEAKLYSKFFNYAQCNDYIEDFTTAANKRPLKKDEKCYPLSSFGNVTELFVPDTDFQRAVTWKDSNGNPTYYAEKEAFLKVLQIAMDKDALQACLENDEFCFDEAGLVKLEEFCQNLKTLAQTEGIIIYESFWRTKSLDKAVSELYDSFTSKPLRAVVGL